MNSKYKINKIDSYVVYLFQVLQKWFDIEVLISDSVLDSEGEDTEVAEGVSCYIAKLY